MTDEQTAASKLYKGRIEKQAEAIKVLTEALEWIAKTDTASHVYGPDFWRNTRKAAAVGALREAREILG
jgi:hypothetical protein